MFRQIIISTKVTKPAALELLQKAEGRKKKIRIKDTLCWYPFNFMRVYEVVVVWW